MKSLHNLIKPPSYFEQAAKDLHEAQLSLLAEQKAAEYHSAMTEMLKERIERIEDVLSRRPHPAA